MSGMTPHPSLNAFTPGTWARVVSGVVWADYALNEGQVTAKTARGPLALLSLTGEGEDLPRLHAPTPDALEVFNTAVHFQKFREGRKPRPWKNGILPNNLLALGRVRYELADGEERVIAGIKSDLERAVRKYLYRLSSVPVKQSPSGRTIKRFRRKFQKAKWFRKALLLQEYALLFVGFSCGVIALLLSSILDALSWVATVTRNRVRPPERRTRIPRPIHARPRPPTCPAAPPALPAPVC